MTAPSAPYQSHPVPFPDGRLEVVRVQTPADNLEMLEIRRRVFAIEQNVSDLRVSDPDDARSIIALARMQSTAGMVAVGTGRLTLSLFSGGPALVAWVATLPEVRGRGIGSEVMTFLIEAATREGASEVLLAAQAHAESFYRRLGFFVAGPRYDVRGIEHLKMRWTSWR